MSTESVETPVESTTDSSDLDSFAADLFGRSDAAPEPASSEEPESDEVDTDAPKTEEIAEETQEVDPEGEAPEDVTEPEETEVKKPQKNRAQERISELNGKWREEQRKREALEQQLAALQNPKSATNTPSPEAPTGAPTPDDAKEDGTAKYPLGDFDPNYIRDLARFETTQALREQQEVVAKAQAEEAGKLQQQELVDSWNEKLTPALDRYPDFQEKGEELFEALSGLSPDYEDYIAATIMQLDYGPDVLYYLSSNPQEAQTIVNAGPTKAAVLLGRIESKFAAADAEKTLARPKVSKAPAPPPVNKGSAIARGSVAPDTDDLEAFTREFVKKKQYK